MVKRLFTHFINTRSVKAARKDDFCLFVYTYSCIHLKPSCLSKAWEHQQRSQQQQWEGWWLQYTSIFLSSSVSSLLFEEPCFPIARDLLHLTPIIYQQKLIIIYYLCVKECTNLRSTYSFETLLLFLWVYQRTWDSMLSSISPCASTKTAISMKICKTKGNLMILPLPEWLLTMSYHTMSNRLHQT